MSLRSAQAFAIVWLVNAAAIFGISIALFFVDEWRQHTSTSYPTQTASTAYVDHGRRLFAPPAAARWHDRLSTAFLWLMLTFVLLSVAGFLLIPEDATGRRWGRRARRK
jgi:hypothetical protein